MAIKIGDVVKINCRPSKYDGVVGEVYKIQKSSQYAIVDMPKGTEYRIEGFRENAIMAEMKRSDKKRKTPRRRRPKGDPEWFPLSWLVPVESAEQE